MCGVCHLLVEGSGMEIVRDTAFEYHYSSDRRVTALPICSSTRRITIETSFVSAAFCFTELELQVCRVVELLLPVFFILKV